MQYYITDHITTNKKSKLPDALLVQAASFLQYVPEFGRKPMAQKLQAKDDFVRIVLVSHNR